MGIIESTLAATANSGYSNAGSAQSSWNNANNFSDSYSSSVSGNDAADARAWAAEQAKLAYERQKELMQMEMEYNAAEAQKGRDWQTEMANTVYTRSVNNMKEAGINPVLAASAGLSAATVGSAQTASIGSHGAPIAQGFTGTTSKSSSMSHAEGYQAGGSQGSSWQDSAYGLAVGLEMLGKSLNDIIDLQNSGQILNNMAGAAGVAVDNVQNEISKWAVENLPNNVSNALGISYNPHEGSSNTGSRKVNITGSGTVSGSYTRHSGGGTGF